ncbi:thioredoxin family protein [Pseudomonas sp. NPDC087639]|uniref:thioredoxin family protein n=1 Tax=Pseudomonas sp. NPDC087639 TaxID=3364445 RepID=UPI0037F6F744
MATITLTDQNFDENVLRANVPVLVCFNANWGPANDFPTKIMPEIAEEKEGRLIVGIADIEQSSVVALRYGVNGTPTFVLFKDGKITEHSRGAKSKSAILNLINPHI